MRLRLHSSVQLAWAIASHEAYLSGSSKIDPVHVFVAVLQILDDAFHEEAERLDLSAEDIAELRNFADDGRQLLGFSPEEVTRLRRSTQRSMHSPDPSDRPRRIQRSDRVRGLFKLTEGVARGEKSPEITVRHLLRALLSYPSPDLVGVVPGKPATKPDFTWETRIQRFSDHFEASRITILLSDIEDSMALKSRYGDREGAKIFRAHDHVFRDELEGREGAQEIKTLGDGFLLAFSSEEEAVRFALRVQAALRTHPQLSKLPVRVRIGVCTGDILQRATPGSTASDPIFGITIDTASRISSLAVGDQILIDRSVYGAAHESISANPPSGVGEVAWQSYGDYELKGLDAPLEIFEVGEVGQAAFSKPSGPGRPAPNLLAPSPGPAADTPSLGSPLTGATPTPSLDLFGRDLTQLAREGRLAHVVGRRQEIRTLARHLQRTTKRNVLVIGDAGVGKTAVVEGFAQWITSLEASDPFHRLRILQISVADLLAGAKYRGDMEERIQGILDDATANPDVVVFFDEFHLVMRAGGGDGAPDLANIMKPSLAGEDFRCIGATTTEEFEQHVKSDAALMRRFQVLRVPEPTIEEAVEICMRWARRIEEYQQVRVEDDAVEAAVTLSADLVRGRSLPDKAIDLLENAATLVKVSSLSTRLVVPTKEELIVTRKEIELVLEEQYGIPADASRGLDPQRVREELSEKIVGQADAIGALVQTLSTSMHARKVDRPTAVFMFAGPTGVGKTFAAECLAAALFPGEADGLCRLNMSEFKERHEIAKLIGAPPGFVGHGRPGALFLHVEKHPQGVILLDEMEKAHSEIQDYFLQIFDKAEAMDSRGRSADFRRQIFVMTCNIFVGEAAHPHMGFQSTEQESSHALKTKLAQHFRREFLARTDRIIEFRPLGRADFMLLLETMARDLKADLEENHGTRLEISEGAKEMICELGEQQEEGARGFIRLFERHIMAPSLDRAASGPGDGTIRVEYLEGERLSISGP